MKKSIKSEYYVLTFVIICTLVILYTVIRSYVVKSCQNKYDLSYNVKRKALGIPIIPNNWHIKERDPEFIWWTDNEKVIGHGWKTIAFSGCRIESESDTYTLPLQNGKGRWLEIDYKYGISPHPDSVFYKYQIDHTAKGISKKITDSIFKAENINKDYY
jgi:hypothetical protein